MRGEDSYVKNSPTRSRRSTAVSDATESPPEQPLGQIVSAEHLVVRVLVGSGVVDQAAVD
jgi:hypothetical protein